MAYLFKIAIHGLSEKYQKQGIITRSVDRLCDYSTFNLNGGLVK
jgi:hypothetical protein